jgi:hypothetical protein
VLRRLNCVLARTKEKVLARQAQLRGRGLQNLDQQLRRTAGFDFYNTSRYDRQTVDAERRKAELGIEGRNYVAVNSWVRRTNAKRELLGAIEREAAARGVPPRFSAAIRRSSSPS